MKRFIQGEHRSQGTSLSESLDDYVSQANPVRVVDVFVDELDLVKLGFEGAIPADTGLPAYHPAGYALLGALMRERFAQLFAGGQSLS